MKRICQGVTNVTKWHWRSVAVHTIPKPENCHDAEFLLRAGAGIRVQDSAGFI